MGLEQVSSRGLIAGIDYGGERLAGIWGLYGTYDYLAPDDYRISSTAFTVGTTIQASISDSLLVQGSGLVGVGTLRRMHSTKRTGTTITTALPRRHSPTCE